LLKTYLKKKCIYISNNSGATNSKIRKQRTKCVLFGVVRVTYMFKHSYDSIISCSLFKWLVASG